MTARAAALAAPVLTRRIAPRAKARPVIVRGGDRWLVFTVAALVTISVVMVFNTSYFFAGERFGDPLHVFKKHLASIALGGLACFVASRLRSATYERLAYPALALVAVLLIAVLIPGVGIVRGGARRWIGLGFINLQPSELAKIVAVLYLAHSMVRKGPRLATFALGVLPHVIVTGALAGLVAQEPDFGTAALLGITLFAMLFAGGVRWRHLLLPVLPIVPLAAWAVASSPYRLRRVLVFLDPWQHSRDAGFQLVQSFLAFGSGGIFGAGLGESKQKMFYLPEAHTDFIFSVIGEELGLVGALVVVGLFAVLAVRGLRVALRHPTTFGQLVAFGTTTVLVLQAGINMAVVLGLLPTKGLALPFVSYGGSAMIGAMAALGVLIALSRESG
ncbi:MAG: putative lipid II flippase FtsW [Polyangiaceae bacterium UTPRO1]|jgi:cell division protein FtsW|nr:putative lipid II flippase FtsW [Myxococcales bacterium]OQY66713.1 MAG: putative lipid II flippase FtsW [Polyangiaceae bacterium UTPRO1]